jgi:Lantibiotic biosynthesis dehydratase C-term
MTPAGLPPVEDGWLGFHLVHHGDRERLLREAVRPLAAELVRDGLVTRFFVIHYLLGGPHLRLRVQCDRADAAAVRARVHEAAAAFFARAPSAATQPDEEVHRQNRRVIPSDPFATEADDVVFADDSVVELPVHFEVDRYGGPALYGRSVELFGISTLEVMGFLDAHAGASAGRRTAGTARLLLRQAWGHARDAEEFAVFAQHGVRMFGVPLAAAVQVADAAFERTRTTMVALVRAEIAALAGAERPGLLAEGARSLAQAVRSVPDEPRRFIAISHLHMTANRLGMRNPDEVYLGRILALAVDAFREEHPAEWAAAWDAHRAWSRVEGAPLEARLREALDEFARRESPVPA